MTNTLGALRAALEALSAVGAHFAVIGGFAVAVRCEPRFTRDVDFAIAVADDPEAERLTRALGGHGFELVCVLEQTARGRLSTARLLAPGGRRGRVTIDLLFASSGIEPEVVAEAETLTIAADLTAPVARTGHLIAMKLLSRDDVERPQDVIDLRALLGVANRTELARARRAAALIHQRGFARGRDLKKSLAAMLAAGRGAQAAPARPTRRRPGRR